MLRLVAYAPDGVRRFPLRRPTGQNGNSGELVIGSEPDCDVHLPYTGVARRHAALRFDGDSLAIRDLGSRKGMQVSGKRVKEASLAVLDEVRLGAVTLLVEDVAPEPVGPPAPPADEEGAEPPAELTPERMLDHIRRLSEWVLTDVESRTTSEALVAPMLEELGGGLLLLLQGGVEEVDRSGIKLVVASRPRFLAGGEGLVDQVKERLRPDDEGAGEAGCAFEGSFLGEDAWICAHAFTAVARPYVMITALPRFEPEAWSPASALGTLGHLLILGLVHHVGEYEPILPGRGRQQDLTLDPDLVLGASPASERLLEALRTAVDPPVNVHLRGEAGVGKAMLARSLHLSGPRRRGPFVVATCTGASPVVLEADLFGSEVPGKAEVLRREGKLSLADGGTLFLDDVDELPLSLQARLVRLLRSGEVEPAGSSSAYEVDVRLIVGSRGPLEPAVARDRFRVDLAYRLGRMVIDVPPLRERREDLPLTIQSYVNRFCHQTGKRVAGITVKAKAALLAYDYPGNLEELENIVRQLFFLCPSGRPIDVNVLPERVRQAPLHEGATVDQASELDLERLVAKTEAAAIREALRRTEGNKSQAAKLLGLSRNGLALKIERYGLATT